MRNGELGLSPLKRLDDKSPKGDLESVYKEIREVLTKARGEDGKIKRRNAARIAKQLPGGWEEGGSCQKDIQNLLNLMRC